MSRMSVQGELDRRWHDLMSMCQREREFQSNQRHPKLVRLISRQIDTLAAEMGFSEAQIARREFRAEKNGEHIVRLLVD